MNVTFFGALDVYFGINNLTFFTALDVVRNNVFTKFLDLTVGSKA
jgi:hypothetical protein